MGHIRAYGAYGSILGRIVLGHIEAYWSILGRMDSYLGVLGHMGGY